MLVGLLSLVIGGVIGSCITGAVMSQAGKPSTPSGASEASTGAQGTAATVATSAVAAQPAGPKTSFGDGTYQVNTDIVAGTYKTTVPPDSAGCYWGRLKDMSGGGNSIIANDFANAGSPVTVKILKTDVGFRSQGCGTWAKA